MTEQQNEVVTLPRREFTRIEVLESGRLMIGQGQENMDHDEWSSMLFEPDDNELWDRLLAARAKGLSVKSRSTSSG